MNSKVFFCGFIIFQIFLFIPNTISYKYNFDLTNEDIFTPCDMDDANYVDEYLDLSNIKFQFLDDGTVYVNGEAVLIKDIGQDMNPVSLQIFKKNRDKWSSTVYNLKRNDMCTALYSPHEMWHNYLKDVPMETRTCPMPKGMVFPVNSTSDMSFPDLPDPRLDGDYKLQILINLVGINEVVCANVLGTIYRE